MSPSVVVCIACCATKRARRSPARELYASRLFQTSVRWAEAQGLPWVVLSAKHGIVEPDQELDPYDESLASMTPAQRREWGARIRQELANRYGVATFFVVLGGEHYRAPFANRMPFWRNVYGELSRRHRCGKRGAGIGNLTKWLAIEADSFKGIRWGREWHQDITRDLETWRPRGKRSKPQDPYVTIKQGVLPLGAATTELPRELAA